MPPLAQTERRKKTSKNAQQEATSENRDQSAPRPPGTASHMFERPLMLVSLNVRGLRGDSPKLKEIKAWITSLSSPFQILLIQEHHLGKDGIQSSGKGIKFWNGTAFWNEGIPMGRSQRTNAGIAILVDRATAPLIKDHDILVEGRAQYVSLQSPGGGSLTVINIYAQQSSNNRPPSGEKLLRPASPRITFW